MMKTKITLNNLNKRSQRKSLNKDIGSLKNMEEDKEKENKIRNHWGVMKAEVEEEVVAIIKTKNEEKEITDMMIEI